MNLRKVRLVGTREYLSNVKTKGFWIGVLIMPLIFIASAVVPILIDRGKDVKYYAVWDKTGWVADAVEAQILADDLSVLFEAYGKASNKARFPTVLESLHGHHTSLDEAQARAFLLKLAAPDISGDGLDPASTTVLKESGQALREWWQSSESLKTRRGLEGLHTRRHARSPKFGTSPKLTELNQALENEELYAYFILDGDLVTDGGACQYITTNLANEDLKSFYQGFVESAVREKRLEREAITPEVATWITDEVPFASQLLGKQGVAKEADDQDKLKQWAPVAFVYLLWLCVFMVSMNMLTSTVTEKSNRLMEVLLSSVSAIELMAGKVIGTAATGLTTVGIWLVSFIGATLFLPAMLGANPGFSLSAIASDPVFLFSFLVYFTLGYLFYGAILVGLGSICDNLKDAQNLASPVTLTLFVPMLLMLPIAEDPNGSLARVVSYIPPLTPFVMMNRAAGPPPMIDYVLTTILMLVSVSFALWAAAKIFRVGVLLTGKPPKLKELFHWLRQPM